ncbi:hypothetical protein FQN60_011734 [Etheostoma spectabile]|uniref:LITAF domain-containing protein n=1 Tax=Etheostoma spectabile TaxID=54343 RepID=A0A5J5DMZ8_9PERO|nr:hypothetical protein FQN60_011734 [Etheostoma spectabile]
MEPPSYEEATLHPSGPGTAALITSYHSSLTNPSTPPPTYVEAVGASDRRRQPQPTVVVTQPQPVPVLITHLGDIPGLVSCPHCHHVVTSKVTYVPGNVAWCMCLLITLMGFICGCCLIPFGLRSLQDVHHSCPRCGKHLGIYKR